MNTTASPVVWYARIFGVVLTLVGLAGLAINTEQGTVESLMGFDVNLTHNLVHLITGVLGIAVGFFAMGSARVYALVLGIVYAVLGVWGLVAGGETFDPLNLFVNINMADNLLHLLIGVVGIACWAMVRGDVEETVV